MGLYVTIDEGNSALKAALWDNDLIVGRLATENHSGSAASLPERLREEWLPSASGVAYSTVVKGREDLAGELAARCRGRFIRLTAESRMPLTIDYESRGTLGADRIAAAAGALGAAGGRPALVADIGTAVTYDMVSAEGHFAGGNIAPGPLMRLRALSAYTSALPETSPRGDTPLWGRDTTTALRSGALRGVAAEIDYYSRRLPEGGVTVVTGGQAWMVEPLIENEFITVPDLVMRGLKLILDYNEDI